MKVVIRHRQTGLETTYEDYDIVVRVGDDDVVAATLDLADFVDAHADLQQIQEAAE